MGLIGCPEMSVRNYHYLLLNNPEECSSRLGTTLIKQNNMHDKFIGLNMGIACCLMVLVKVEIKVFPVCTMNAYRGVQVYCHLFLTSALDGGEWSASHPDYFTPVEKAGFTWIRVVFLFAI